MFVRPGEVLRLRSPGVRSRAEADAAESLNGRMAWEDEARRPGRGVVGPRPLTAATALGRRQAGPLRARSGMRRRQAASSSGAGLGATASGAAAGWRPGTRTATTIAAARATPAMTRYPVE